MNRKPKRGERLRLEIESLAFGGKGIARLATETEGAGYVVFVPNTIPGQVVLARITKRRNRYAEGKLLEVLERSPEEVALSFQPIPGAPYATWPLEKQRQEKQQSTLELFKRIGHIQDVEEAFDGYIASPVDWHYRNKMEYSFSTVRYDLETREEYDEPALGFKHRGQWLAVENLDRDSGLFDQAFEDRLHELRTWCEASELPFWHPARHHGFYRFLTVRKSLTQDQLLINLTTSSSHLEDFDAEAYVQKALDLWGERIAGLLLTINDSTGDRQLDASSDIRVLYGKDHLTDTLLDLEFEIGIESFFQPNPRTAALLYTRAAEYVFEGQEDQSGVVMDLFCGTGTIGQVLTQQGQGKRPIIGVDIVDRAIEDARENAKRNGLQGLEFFAADVGKFLYQYPEYKGNIHTVVLDPPRGGIAPKTLKRILELDAQRIVYVSCNPATQARDTVELNQAGYALKKLTLVDQFPHTAHIETVALFDKQV